MVDRLRILPLAIVLGMTAAGCGPAVKVSESVSPPNGSPSASPMPSFLEHEVLLVNCQEGPYSNQSVVSLPHSEAVIFRAKRRSDGEEIGIKVIAADTALITPLNTSIRLTQKGLGEYKATGSGVEFGLSIGKYKAGGLQISADASCTPSSTAI